MPPADLSDCPPAKRERGNPSLRIGDDGPMGRVLIAGEPGTAILDGARADRPARSSSKSRARAPSTPRRFGEELTGLGARQLVFAGVTTEVCVQTTMREANDRGYECLLAEDATESYFPSLQGGRARDDPRPGRDRRLDGDDRSGAGGLMAAIACAAAS